MRMRPRVQKRWGHWQVIWDRCFKCFDTQDDAYAWLDTQLVGKEPCS